MTDQLAEHQRTVAAVAAHIPLLENIADRILDCFVRGGRLYLCGNGGSAADAQHIAAELVGRFKQDRRPLPAVALTTDSSILTAVTNDLGADVAFSRQVEAHVRKGDILWVLSVSGKSENVIRAAKTAKSLGACVIGFTGRSGGMLKQFCDFCFQVDHDRSDRVQEVHQLAYHLICDRLERHVVEGMKSSNFAHTIER